VFAQRGERKRASLLILVSDPNCSLMGVWLVQNDEFISLVKQWTKDELANDDFFTKVRSRLKSAGTLVHPSNTQHECQRAL
jgi:hypothetical protein